MAKALLNPFQNQRLKLTIEQHDCFPSNNEQRNDQILSLYFTKITSNLSLNTALVKLKQQQLQE